MGKRKQEQVKKENMWELVIEILYRIIDVTFKALPIYLSKINIQSLVIIILILF